jgi:hypothetical protein
MKASTKTPDEQATVIETKRKLLAYLRSGPKHLTIESYLCIANILSRAGWNSDSARWSRNGQSLTMLEAAILELEKQVATDTDRLLRRTVTTYRTNDNTSRSNSNYL